MVTRAHAFPMNCWRRKVQIVDTTCPWVSKVWNAVDSHRSKGQTRYIGRLYALCERCLALIVIVIAVVCAA